MTIPSTADVLIVGAGPTGLMLANQLARRGVRAVIVERNAGPSVQTKALGVQARTLEIYSQMGLADRALELGTRAAGANLWVSGRRAARIPLGDIGRTVSPFPFVLVLGQDDNERLLGEALRTHGIEVHWSTELVGLEQTSDGVTATLKRADGSAQQVTARWVAGCDGAHSAVRTLNGIAFPGAPYEHVFFVADTVATGAMVPHELNIYLQRHSFHLFFPMRGPNHWRVVGIVPREMLADDQLGFDAVAPQICRQVGSALVFEKCSWFATYRIHHRRAARFRDRRCFLLGDAAHIHSPVGAQGMNTGLQDAYNLAWKLALVVSGRAGSGLLDSYEAERIPVAERLLKSTDRAFALVVSDRLLVSLIRTHLVPQFLAFALRFERVRRLVFRTVSQIGIRYPHSPLSQSLPSLSAVGPQPGERFPWLLLKFKTGGPAEDLFERLDGTRFNLILVGQQLRPGDLGACADLVQVLEVGAHTANDQALKRAGISTPSFFLLRPDGHIGLAGARVEASDVSRYLAGLLAAREG